MAYTKADVMWSGYCDIESHLKDVNLVIHHFFKYHACNDLKFREMRLTESGKCVLVSIRFLLKKEITTEFNSNVKQHLWAAHISMFCFMVDLLTLLLSSHFPLHKLGTLIITE